MAHDEHASTAGFFLLAIRRVVPWLALAAVIAVLWSFIGDYRAAVDSKDPNSSTEPTPTAQPTAGAPYVRVLSDGLNLRAEPSTTAQVLKVLAVEQQLVFIEEGIGWYHVRDADGTEGWVAAGGRYTELVEP